MVTILGKKIRENFKMLKKIYHNHKQIFVAWTKDNYFSVNSAIELIQKEL